MNEHFGLLVPAANREGKLRERYSSMVGVDVSGEGHFVSGD